MNVLFDYQIFVAQKFGGISRYFVELMNGIDKRNDVSYKLDVYGNSNYYLSEENIRFFSFTEKIKKYNRKPQKIFNKNQQIVLKSLNSNSVDIFHPTYYDPYFIKDLKKPLVITIHDMIYENFPGIFSPDSPIAYYKRLHIEKADKIIAVSHQTKEDILKYYKLDENKIDVVYHGIDITQTSPYEHIQDLPELYILYVGNRYGYKNFALLIEAFSLLSNRYSELKLILAGGPMQHAEQELLYRNRVIDKVIQIAATDAQLNMLYKNALFFVYPSLYEGFGLPILEAFKNGCPVLLSNASCFPEIAGDAAAYFEATSVDSLLCQMKKMLESSTNREYLIKSGKQQLALYSVESCVANTVESYKKLS